MNPQTQEEILTRKAVLARERLMAVVDELDRKRHQLAHPMQLITKARALPVSAAVIGAAALVATVGSIALVVIARQRAKKNQVRKFFLRRPPEPSFWSDVAIRTARALTAFALIEAGKRAILGATHGPAERR